jgi:Leucine-rich repeat (LRR) protein
MISEIEVKKTFMEQIQKSQETDAKAIDLCALSISEVYKELFSLSYLKKIDLSMNKLDKIPHEFAYLTALKSLNFSSNRINDLNDFPYLPTLETLELSENQISVVPDTFCRQLPALKSLSLESNSISSLPQCFSQFSKLEELYLQSNRFTHIPFCLGNTICYSESLFLLLSRSQRISLTYCYCANEKVVFRYWKYSISV